MHNRVLIVGTIPYNKQTSSRAFDSYFHYWEKENIAQIFSNPREPVHGHCNTFFQITDKALLKKRINKDEDIGVIYYDEELSDDWNQSSEPEGSNIISSLYGLGSRKFPLNYLLRGWLWKKKYWCTQKLNKWLDEFNPECVFLAFSDDFFIPRIALYVAEKYDIPIISCIGDDYYFNDRVSISPFYYFYRNRYKKLIDQVFCHGGSAAYIGNKIRDKYNGEFNIFGETVYLTSEIRRHEFRPINLYKPIITYCGNVRLGRNDSLCAIADALGKIDPNYTIKVYSNETEQKFYKNLQNHPNIEFNGSIPYSEVMKLMDESDILLVVEGFDKKDINITRYSLSTKVADSLATGTAVLALGSIECGAIEYMKSIECGPVCTDISELDYEIHKLLYDVDYQREIYNNSKRVSMLNHTLENSNRIFENVVKRAISEYKDGRHENKR